MGIANGVEYIPRVADEISRRAEDSRIQFVLVGDGTRKDFAEAVAADLGVLGVTVHFLGSLPKREVAAWMAAADATIITYDGPAIVFRDSLSNKFSDSIAAGKPVIANFAGFPSMTAAEAGAGFIVSRDPGVPAEEILRIFSTPETIRSAGEAAAVL